MTPEMERALRLNPRLRKRLREQQVGLLAAVEAGNSEAVLAAAIAWAEAEHEAARDLTAKTASPPKHRVSFLVAGKSLQSFHSRQYLGALLPHQFPQFGCARLVRYGNYPRAMFFNLFGE